MTRQWGGGARVKMPLWVARQRAKALFKEGVEGKTMAGTWKIGTRYRNEKDGATGELHNIP